MLVLALGVTWILDGLEVTLVGAVSGVLQDARTLGFTPAEIGFAATCYLIGAVGGSLVFGYLTDRYGRRLFFFITLSIYLVGALLTAFAWDLWSFIAFRMLTGAGIGGEYAAINSAIDELVPARLHRMLSQSYRDAQVDLCAYVRELCGSLTNALSPKGQARITCQTANPHLLPPDQVLTIGLLISELVTNAVKYARPCGLSVQIDVYCRQTDGRLVLHIADDGVGLPDNFDPEKDGGLGLRMVRSFAKQLGGTLRFESPGTGTSVRLEMPLSDQD
jgi:hypothetical protein